MRITIAVHIPSTVPLPVTLVFAVAFRLSLAFALALTICVDDLQATLDLSRGWGGETVE